MTRSCRQNMKPFALAVRAMALASSSLAALTPAAAAAEDVAGSRAASVQEAVQVNRTTADTSGEIVVTAQKRSERLQDVPISISAVTGTALQEKSLTQVSQLSQSVPALRIDYAGNTIQPTIRGVGSQVAGPGFYSNIPFYVDGYYIPSPTSSDLDLVNIASVNVLKGPQGTLFGYNATGGAIQIATLDPTQRLTALARASFASYNKASAAAYVAGGLAPGLSMLVAGSYDHGTGFITNIVTGDKHVGRFTHWSGRAKLKWDPNSDVHFTLAYGHTDVNDPYANNTNARDGQTIGVIIPGNIIATQRGQISNNAPNFVRLKTNSYTLTSRFNLGFADLTSYTGFRTDKVSQGLEYDDTPANIFAAQWTIPDKTFTQEVNLTSKGSGRFNWVLGAFYMHTQNVYNYFISNPSSPDGTGAPFIPLFTSKNTNRSYALFADGTYEVVDKLFLTVGGRYSWDNPHLSFNLFPASLTGDGGVKFRNFSPRAVIRYMITPHSNVYGSFTKGYKAGTLPGSSFSLVPVKPETIDAFEVGYKIANHLVRFNVAGYYYNYKDIQVTAYGASGTSITRNAAAAHIYGLDGDLSLQLSREFDVTLSGAYTHARYQSFRDAIGFVQDLNATHPTFGQFQNVNIDATGFPVQRTPEFSGSIGANYHTRIAGGKLALNGNLFYSSKFYFDAVKQLPQKAYELLNLKATWTDPSDRFDLSVFGTNITNTKIPNPKLHRHVCQSSGLG